MNADKAKTIHCQERQVEGKTAKRITLFQRGVLETLQYSTYPIHSGNIMDN